MVGAAQRAGGARLALAHYLIAGGGGMLGVDLAAALSGRDVTALGRSQLDITDLNAVRAAVVGHDIVINAAAYTKVDDAESNEALARAVNAVGAQNLAIATSEMDATLVQVSTDYVFDGLATTPYPEDAALAPVSAYGRTKAEGETLAVAANPNTLIVRTAWLYGEHGANFARTMLSLAARQRTFSVVNDQMGQPTWSLDVAGQIVSLLDSGMTSGRFHSTNSGTASWFDFAREVLRLSELDPERVLPTDAASFVRPAPRPRYSVLGHEAWAGTDVRPLRDWHDALAAAFDAGAFNTA
jgi:dTDP-4-dehydrorhamnose reductase